MCRYKILQFKQRYFVVISRSFAQSLRGSWGSSNLSVISFGHTNAEICNTSCSECHLQEVVII